MVLEAQVFFSVVSLGLAGSLALPSEPWEALERMVHEAELELAHLQIEGDPVKEGELPFVAALGLKSNGSFLHGCGGTLLDLPNKKDDGIWILTAAHCAQHQTVLLGKINMLKPLAELDPIQVKSRFCHHQYRNNPIQHDIALLRLEKEVAVWGLPLSTTDLPLTENGLDNGSVTLAGWADGDTLKSAEVRVTSIGFCRKELKHSSIVVDETIFCTWKLGPGGGVTEQDDSGGPAIANGALVGLIFAGDNPGEPDVHLNLVHYREWILGVVGGDESKTDDSCLG